MVVILPLLSSVKSAEAHVGFAPWPSFSVCVCTCRPSWAAPCSPSPSIPLRPSLLSYFGRLHQLLLYLLNLADPTCMVFFYLTQKSWVSVCPAAAQKLSIMHVPSQAAWGWIAPRNPAQAHFGDLFKKKNKQKNTTCCNLFFLQTIFLGWAAVLAQRTQNPDWLSVLQRVSSGVSLEFACTPVTLTCVHGHNL